MNVAYILAPGKSKRGDDFELKHSLRSLAEQDWVEDVFLVGYRPAWATDVIHVPCDDPYPAKDANIISKILKAAEAIGGPFVVNSDDQYLLQPVTVDELGPWLENPCKLDRARRQTGPSLWSRRLVDTVGWCKANGYPQWVFQSHVPYVVGEDYAEVMGRVPWAEGNGLVTHVYFNLSLSVEPEPEPIGMVGRVGRAMAKNKVLNLIERASFLNHNDPGLCDPLVKWLEHRFPTPSRWEI